MTITRTLERVATWSATASTTEAAVHVLGWLVALVGAYLVLVTATYVAALVLRLPAAARIGSLTPWVLRRLAERVVAACLLTTAAVGPAAATTTAPGFVPPGLRVPVPIGTAAAPSPPPAGVPLGGHAAERSVLVGPGDHLWAIAARALADARGAAVDDLPLADLVTYWRVVVALNTPHLRSGDPDLVHPGETVRLP